MCQIFEGKILKMTVSRNGSIPVLSLEAQLKRKLRSHFSSLGFIKGEGGLLSPPTGDKTTIRKLHSVHRADKIASSERLIALGYSEFEAVVANGSELSPEDIELSLIQVKSNTFEARLFRLASLTWSVPVSSGFGRRMRYLVWDKYHEKLAGIIALGDPVFNLNVRDQLINWDASDRSARLCNILDAYVLGALPPYNHLLVGKAIACLIQTRDVYDDFQRKYGETVGIISGKQKAARLLAITTSSSMGRSSVYNRLNLGGKKYLEPIGYTKGWGHFHIPDALFEELRDYLRQQEHPYVNQNDFGQGPNWRLRTIRAAFKALGLQQNLLHHGIKRQVFLGKLAANSFQILRTGEGTPDLSKLLSVSEVSALAKQRWIVPRSRRQIEYKSWNRENIINLIYVRNERMNLRKEK